MPPPDPYGLSNPLKASARRRSSAAVFSTISRLMTTVWSDDLRRSTSQPGGDAVVHSSPICVHNCLVDHRQKCSGDHGQSFKSLSRNSAVSMLESMAHNEGSSSNGMLIASSELESTRMTL